MFFLEAKGSFSIGAGSKVQTGVARRWRSATCGCSAFWHGVPAQPHNWQAVLSCISLCDLGSPPKLTSSCLGRIPISAQSSCIPCSFLFWRWKCSTSMSVGQHQALMQAVRRSQLLEEITNPLSLCSTAFPEQHPRPMCYLRIKVLISVIALWIYCLQWLCWIIYGGNFLCPGETEVEKGDHTDTKVPNWHLRDLGLIPSTDFLGQTAKSPTSTVSKRNVEISSNLPSGAESKTWKKLRG